MTAGPSTNKEKVPSYNRLTSGRTRNLSSHKIACCRYLHWQYPPEVRWLSCSTTSARAFQPQRTAPPASGLRSTP